MSEQLGDAVLVLRTDDSQYNAGIAKAEVGAKQLGTTLDRTTASAGAQRAGMQQLGMQIGDMATMYSLGARPAQIFASQIGQVTQAIQLASGGTSKFANFLSGPWGIALTVATIVLAPFIGKLFETGDAADDAAKRIEGTTKAIQRLQEQAGKFDFGSAEFRTLQSAQLGARAREARLSQELKTAPVDGGMVMTAGAPNAATAPGRTRSVVEAELAAARQQREKLDGDMKALMAQRANRERLDTPAPNAQRTPRTRTSRGPSEAEIAARQASALGALSAEELRARIDLTSDVTERADLQKELLQLERDQRIRAIEADKTLSDAQKAAQIAILDRLIGKPAERGPNGEIIARGPPGLLAQRINRDAEAQQAQLDIDMLARQREALDAQAGMAVSLKERDRLESAALKIQQDIEKALLEQDIANGRVADADQARAMLAERQAAQRQQLIDSQKGPMARFRDELAAAEANMDLAIEDIQVDGLKALNEELADAILGAKSLGEAFGNVADQIVRDLLRIAIQRAVIAPLADALFGSGDGGGGGFLGELLNAAGSFFGGKRALGGPITAGKAYLVGERGPEIVVPGASGTVIPNHQLGGGGFTVSVPVSIDATGADPAGLARVAAALERLRAELPGQIVQTVQEAGDRRIISARNWR